MHYLEVLPKLETGELRAAYKVDNKWLANSQVKSAILEAFRDGVLKECSDEHYPGFVEKSTLLPRHFAVQNAVRLVPGGSSVRTGTFIARGVIIMPPSFINIGAFVDEGSMIDSHVLVGSCAQIGKRVHLSAGVQIGGVLEPIGDVPVVIEDDCFIGAGAIIVEGVHVLSRAVIAPGVRLSKSIPVYDVVNEILLAKGAPIPENAVVVPGARALTDSTWAQDCGLSLSCAIIVKYRDDQTSSSLALETALR